MKDFDAGFVSGAEDVIREMKPRVNGQLVHCGQKTERIEQNKSAFAHGYEQGYIAELGKKYAENG